jgi:septal ring factor EnvC (AmiA/AmiB activator)
MNDLSSAVTQLRAQNDAATLRKEVAGLRRQVEELRALLSALRAEAAALREENAWQKRWIKELREAVATLTGPDVTAAPSPPQTGVNVPEPDAAA